MKAYENIADSIKQSLESIVASDPYGLRAESLYSRIAASMGTDESLAEIFEVPPSLVKEIKAEANDYA